MRSRVDRGSRSVLSDCFVWPALHFRTQDILAGKGSCHGHVMFWLYPWRIIAVDLWLHSGTTPAFTRRIPGLRSETSGALRVPSLDCFANRRGAYLSR